MDIPDWLIRLDKIEPDARKNLDYPEFCRLLVDHARELIDARVRQAFICKYCKFFNEDIPNPSGLMPSAFEEGEEEEPYPTTGICTKTSHSMEEADYCSRFKSILED